MEKKSLYLGVDVGTSSMKIILIDDSGKVLKQASGTYGVESPREGWMEIDPEKWIQVFVSTANELLTNIDRDNVKRMGITGQMHTLVLLGNDGEVLRPAIMWNDLRTKDLIPQMKKELRSFSGGEYLSAIISTGSPLSNMFWVKKNEPSIFRRINKFQIGWDYLVYRLTGKHCTDYCNASTSAMYSFEDEGWSQEIGALLDLDMSCYPEICGSADCAGLVLEEFRKQLSLPEGVEVIVGTGDNPASFISTGGYWNHRPVFSMGTSGVMTRMFKREPVRYFGKKIHVAFQKGKCTVLEQGAVQSYGSTYDWWRKLYGNIDSVKVLEEAIDITKEASTNILFYPHLLGDKTLYADPELRGMFAGLDIKADQKTMLYCVLEGICFSVKELADNMRIFDDGKDALQVLGGASDNELWMQILSNVLQIKIEKLTGILGAVYGIALLAANSECLETMEEITKRVIKVKKEYLPSKELKEEYEKKYKCYLRMREAMQYIFENEDCSCQKGENCEI